MGGKFLITVLSIGVVACVQQGKLAIRPLPTTLAQGNQSVSFRVAEAAGQFALGNVALALESYRKALREDPQSIDALVGRAACYDAFGRYDLSRRDYETALAQAPTNVRLLGLFAASLLHQGHGEEATAIQREIASRINPASAAASVTVPLPVARKVSAEATALAPASAQSASPAPVPETAESAPQFGVRLERLSLGEVALVTGALRSANRPPKAREIERPNSLVRLAGIQPSSLRPFVFDRPALRPLLVLNAARSEGLAGRTRHYLAARGFGSALIGDAPHPRARTMILAPPSERARALRLARAFAITPLTKLGTRLTLVLGRDAVWGKAAKG